MNLLLTLFASIVIFGSAQAQTNSSNYLLVDDRYMTLVKVADFSDANKVCYRYLETSISTNCDGYIPANKLHKVLDLDENFMLYSRLDLTSKVLMTIILDGEKKSQLLKFALATEDGYVGFFQGSGYSWKSNSRFYDTRVPSDAFIVVAPNELKNLKLINAIPNHASIGKSWREGDIKLTILSVFENGLVEVEETYCRADSNKVCSAYPHTHSLRKTGFIK